MRKLKSIIARWVLREYFNDPKGFKSQFCGIRATSRRMTLAKLWAARKT